MRIGEFARLTGLSVATLRRYEAAGLLSPTARDEFGYRRYAAAQLAAATHVHRLVQAGLPTTLVKALLDALEDPALDEQARRERVAAVAAYMTPVTTSAPQVESRDSCSGVAPARASPPMRTKSPPKPSPQDQPWAMPRKALSPPRPRVAAPWSTA